MPNDSETPGADTSAGSGDDFITIITSHTVPLAKRVYRDSDGVTKVSDRRVFPALVEAEEKPVSNLADLGNFLPTITRDPQKCIIHGQPLRRQSKGVRRAIHGANPGFKPASHRWLALDFDGFSVPAGTDITDLECVGLLARELLHPEFQTAGFIVQATSGHGIKEGARLRLWFWLSRSLSNGELKAWLQGLPVDHAIFSDVQPIFTAAPIFADGLTDHLPSRIAHVAGDPFIQAPAIIYTPGTANNVSGRHATHPIEDTISAVHEIPNPDLPYDPWRKVMLAIWGATGGGEEGRGLAHSFSEKSCKFDPDYTDQAWNEICNSPPDQIGAGSLFYWARQANPDWFPPSDPRIPADEDFEGEPLAPQEESQSGACGSVAEENGSSESKVDDRQCRVIWIRPENLVDQIREAEAALLESDERIFQRAGKVVRAGVIQEKDRDGTNIARQCILDVDKIRLMTLMSEHATWMKPNTSKKSGGLPSPARCPLVVAESYLSNRGDEWNLRVLTGIINTPTMRHDGTVLSKPGYDKATGLLFDPRGVHYPAVPDQPTREQALEALERLKYLLSEFPFADPQEALGDGTDALERSNGGISASVALSALLTSVVRPSLPAAPMHAISAVCPGSGKSMLVDLVSFLITGHKASNTAIGFNDEELEKRLSTALMQGRQLISLDNISRVFNGDLLNQCLTQERVVPRILGKSEDREVQCTSFLMANGNNLKISADMTRRVVLCSLDARMERPELRPFERDPLAMMRADRGRYLVDVLTILRAYHVVGCPKPPPALNSFNEWSRRVRGALIWLGEEDPVKSMESVRANDPARQKHLAVIEQWRICVGSKTMTASDAINVAKPHEHAEFKEALLAVAGDAGNISAAKLGTWLGKVKGKIVGGMSLESGPQRGGIGTWLLHGSAVSPADRGSSILPQSAKGAETDRAEVTSRRRRWRIDGLMQMSA